MTVLKFTRDAQAPREVSIKSKDGGMMLLSLDYRVPRDFFPYCHAHEEKLTRDIRRPFCSSLEFRHSPFIQKNDYWPKASGQACKSVCL
jgi:hypothetical protein